MGMTESYEIVFLIFLFAVIPVVDGEFPAILPLIAAYDLTSIVIPLTDFLLQLLIECHTVWFPGNAAEPVRMFLAF